MRPSNLLCTAALIHSLALPATSAAQQPLSVESATKAQAEQFAKAAESDALVAAEIGAKLIKEAEKYMEPIPPSGCQG